MRTRPALLCALAVACGGGGSTTKVAEDDTTPEPPTRVPVDEGGEDDDDTGDGLQVEGTMGHLDTADINPVIQSNWDAVQDCYVGGVGKLRYVGGQIELKFRINRDGTVKHVHVARGTLGAWPVEKCILEVAQAMSFAKPKGGEAVFSFPIEFPARGKTVAMDDGLAASDLGPKLPELAECVEAAEGASVPTVAVTLYVGPKGQVTMVGFSSDGDAPIPAAWADCAAELVRAWKLTDPRGTVAKTTVSWSAP